jgi:hypothetical protein
MHTRFRPWGCNAIRRRLFDMVINDPDRRELALALLVQIEVWQLEHDRPADEPRHPLFESEITVSQACRSRSLTQLNSRRCLKVQI